MELNKERMASVAEQMMSGNEVSVGGRTERVGRIGSGRLRTAKFAMGGREYLAIEQNAEKPSPWGKLARAGHQVVQFKDVETNRFVAVAVDGAVTVYGRTRRRGSSE